MTEQDQIIEIQNTIEAPTPNFEYYFLRPGIEEKEMSPFYPVIDLRIDEVRMMLERDHQMEVGATLAVEYEGVEFRALPLKANELLTSEMSDPVGSIQYLLEHNIARRIYGSHSSRSYFAG
jgi:hypothetical protein